MKKLFFIFLLLSIFSLSFSFAENEIETEDDDFIFSVDFSAAYDPKADYISSKDSVHYAHLTGPYYTMEAALYLNAKYLIPEAKADVNLSFELTPLSIKPFITANISPFPFLVFGIGLEGGTGWNIGKIKGLAEYDNESRNYENLTFFKNFYYKAYIESTLQMDTGYIFPGDWTHVLAMFRYRVFYCDLTGTGDGSIWNWQSTGLQAGGLQESIRAVLAYQMPFLVRRAGIMFEMDRHFSADDYAEFYSEFDGAFASTRLSPLVQLYWGEDDRSNLTILLCFYGRRSFSEEHSRAEEEPFLNCTGREWFFERIAFSYTYIL